MRAVLLVALLGLVACKRGDPHERPPAPASGSGVDDGITVPAGSLVLPAIEAWYGVLTPSAANDAVVAQLLDDARAMGVEVNPTDEPAGRWVQIHTSSPADAGYTHQPPMVTRGVEEHELHDVKGAFVIGAGGPSADVEELHRILTTLAAQGAIRAHGWLLDEQTKIVFSPIVFDQMITQAPRSFVQLTTFFATEQPEGVVLASSGMLRFGLPDLIVHLPSGEVLDETWAARVDAAGQALVDRGALDERGVLVAGDQRWGATWAVDQATGERAIELTPIP